MKWTNVIIVHNFYSPLSAGFGVPLARSDGFPSVFNVPLRLSCARSQHVTRTRERNHLPETSAQSTLLEAFS
jgi:hypothetical protein